MYATDLPYIGQTQMIPTAIRNGNSQFPDKSIRLSHGTLTQVLTLRSVCRHLQTVLWPEGLKAANCLFKC